MIIREIKSQITKYYDRDLAIFTTSSFQTHSIPLLHIISQLEFTVPVYFLDTGYHFPETHSFRDYVTEILGLNLKIIRSDTPRHMQIDSSGRLLFTSDPDHCCALNKTQPTESLLKEYDVWINGVRRDQSSVRKEFKIEQETLHNSFRYHPILNWSAKDISVYRKEHKLPEHPLDASGYLSIGCDPCTRKIISQDSRDARWYGMNKTECGLHINLAKK